MESINHKQSQLGKKLELKDELIKKYEEQIKNLDKEMKALKLATFDKDTEIKKLRTDVYSNMEQAALYKEMAKHPANSVTKSVRESKEKKQLDELSVLHKEFAMKSVSSLKKLPDYENIINKLKSLKL